MLHLNIQQLSLFILVETIWDRLHVLIDKLLVLSK